MALTGKERRERDRRWESNALLLGTGLAEVRDVKGRKSGEETVEVQLDDGAVLTMPAAAHERWARQIGRLAELDKGEVVALRTGTEG